MASPFNPRLIVLGLSLGGVEALGQLCRALPAAFPIPILVVQHLSPDAGDGLARLLDETSRIRVKEADADEQPRGGTVYLAPPNYHLMVEPDGRLNLSIDPPVNHARPSADVLFSTAALALGAALLAVVLTGTGEDGSRGLREAAQAGSQTWVQDPQEATAPGMPQAALACVPQARVMKLAELIKALQALATP